MAYFAELMRSKRDTGYEAPGLWEAHVYQTLSRCSWPHSLRSDSWGHSGAVSRNYLGTSFLEQRCPAAPSNTMAHVLHPAVRCVTTGLRWLSSVSNAAGATEELVLHFISL